MSKAIAIDGPAGAGKSTIAKLVASRLKFVYVDTGAMFRAVSLFFISNQLDCSDDKIVNENLDKINIELKYLMNAQLIYLNGKDVTYDIRVEEVSNAASTVAKNEKVREKLLLMERQIAENDNIVMDGRDIGTCVLPNAKLKIFLAADVEERAKRRYGQLIRRGKEVNFNDVLDDLKRRDAQDMNREIAPLKKADDAVLVDSTHMTVEHVINYIVKLAKERGF